MIPPDDPPATNVQPDGTPVIATVPMHRPPTWAVLQRQLFDLLDDSWRVYEQRYCRADGSLDYAGPLESRDGADDFYEAFVHWPTLYRLGGSADLLTAAKWHWEAVTKQLTTYGMVVDEFERGYDWFHLGESMIFFYGLCAADPQDGAFADRAARFAELYLADSPTGNYDPIHKIITAPHNGATGPRWGISDEWQVFGTDLERMSVFGPPLEGVPGVSTWSDLADPASAQLMGTQMAERLGRGDVAVNLTVSSLTTNAWLMGHDDRFRDWTLEYLAAWLERTRANGGIVPDNVDLHGRVGGLHDGRWYGGNYGWHWPHGIYSVGSAITVAAVNGVLLTGDHGWLDLARSTLDAVYARGTQGRVDETEMSIRDRWEAELGEASAEPTLLVPNRHSDQGWFDYQPPQLGLPTWLWQVGTEPQEADRLGQLRDQSGYDWAAVRDFRNKEDAGHEAPWLAYLAGDNPDFPETALRQAIAQVYRRLHLIEGDTVPPEEMSIHHWQRHDPVTTEALLQLTTGTPQLLYNGGLLPMRISYHDLDTGRPGLPPDVAALVSDVCAGRITVQLVNLSGSRSRRLQVVGGHFGADRIDAVTWSVADQSYPGPSPDYGWPDAEQGSSTRRVGDHRLPVLLPPGRRITLELAITPQVGRPSYQDQ